MIVPKLQYVKLNIVKKEVEKDKVNVLVKFSDPNKVSSFREDNTAVIDGQNGWKKVTDGFEKDFSKKEINLSYLLTANIGSEICSVATIKIPSLQKLDYTVEIDSYDDCNSVLIVTGDEGLTIETLSQ